jgi:uncharacterized protein (TIGR03437 family)
VTGKDADWTVTVLPGNRTSGWLTVSPLSGKGPVQLTLTANAADFAPGAYRALLVFQSATAAPQTLTVPVMLVLGPNNSGLAIRAVGNAATLNGTAAPGSMITVFGSNLAAKTNLATGSPVDFINSGVTASVNGVPAPVLFASPGQLNIQVPYAAGIGPAVLSINNNGQVAGALFQVAASAPGIFADEQGSLIPHTTVKAGAVATLYLTGAGEVAPALKTAYSPTAANQVKAVLPVSVTVAGVQAFVQSASLAANQLGTLQVSFIVPPDTPSGPQPVIVTVGKSASPAANVTVQ